MITIKCPQTPTEWDAYFDLRFRVLREPLGKERGSEKNEGDATGTHFALYDQGVIQAVARLDRIEEEVCQVRFVAVETRVQGLGYGKQIMEAVETNAINSGFTKMILHARDYALPFYEKLGYQLIGPSYKLFDVLQHFEMEKQLG